MKSCLVLDVEAFAKAMQAATEKKKKEEEKKDKGEEEKKKEEEKMEDSSKEWENKILQLETLFAVWSIGFFISSIWIYYRNYYKKG